MGEIADSEWLCYSKINPTISNDQQMTIRYIIIDFIMEDNNKVIKCDKG